jgi:hypothetical protein
MFGALAATYLVSISAMLFAATCLLTFVYVVRHLDAPADPNERHTTPTDSVADHKDVREKVVA